MESIIFWGIITALVLVAFISSLRAINAKKLSILESFKEAGDISYYCLKDDKTIQNESCFCMAMSNPNLRMSILEKESFVDLDETTVSDLEINDLCCRMDRCLTSVGSEVLRERLIHQTDSEEAYKLNNLSKVVLGPDKSNDLILALIGLGKIKGFGIFDILNKLLEADSYSITKYLLADIVLILSFLLIFLSPGFGVVAFLIMLGVCISIHFKDKEKMDDLLNAFRYLLKMINTYNLIKSVLKEEKCAEFLFDNTEDLSGLRNGSFWFPKGASLTSNPVDIIFDYIRMVFSFDIILFSKRISDVKKYKESIYRLYYSLGLVDCALSVAKYKQSLDYYCENNNKIEDNDSICLDGLYHPFLRNPVSNDIVISKDILLTGSNASGKSTFLKATGLCVVLMQSFGFAPCRNYKAPWLKVMTSMALRDNIQKGESYYIVEAKSLKRILMESTEEICILCILDEILKGTNTTERIASSVGVLKTLVKDNVFMVAATHDYELTTLLNDYEKYYFTEEIEEDNVIFPYKIHKGVGAGKNAIKLLGILGFGDDVVTKARDMAEKFEADGKWEV